ncbi:MAG: uncharacterized protein QG604_959 [Candidatus Dependentiae bacterium]|nr:uncharacterized protein [Candidatus Dependentiae bacterium]
MTAAFVWNELKKMVVIDHEISQLRKATKKEQDQLTLAHTAHQKKVTALHEAELVIRTLQKEIDRGELSTKELRSQLQRKKNQLSSLISTKERLALEHEICKAEADLDALDTGLMTLLEQQELVKATLKKIKDEVAVSEQAIASLKKCTEDKCHECLEHIANLEHQWEALLPLVPENLRTEYLQLKSRIANPAVPVVSNSCGACFMSLLGQEVMSLSTRSVIRCRNCFRFLYMPDATTESLTGK